MSSNVVSEFLSAVLLFSLEEFVEDVPFLKILDENGFGCDFSLYLFKKKGILVF